MRKLYTIDSNIEIPSLSISGPISTPIRLEVHEVLQLVRAGAKIYEHNPVYMKEKVRVTQQNIHNIEFEKTAKYAAKQRLKEKTNNIVKKPRIMETTQSEPKIINKKSRPKVISNDNNMSTESINDKNDFTEV